MQFSFLSLDNGLAYKLFKNAAEIQVLQKTVPQEILCGFSSVTTEEKNSEDNCI
jgi:hypothetical protein